MRVIAKRVMACSVSDCSRSHGPGHLATRCPRRQRCAQASIVCGVRRLERPCKPVIVGSKRVRLLGGRRRLDDRKALCGILFVLYTDIPWEFLPQELGYGSGMTCWRRLRDWHAAGVWQRLHEVLLARLNAAGVIDWSRAAAGGSHVRALKGGGKPVPARSTGPGRARSTT